METTKKQSEKACNHLSMEECEEMAYCLKKAFTQKEIAKILNRSPSTISREISRNSAQIRKFRYRGHHAQMRSDEKSLIDPLVRKLNTH